MRFYDKKILLKQSNSDLSLYKKTMLFISENEEIKEKIEREKKEAKLLFL